MDISNKTLAWVLVVTLVVSLSGTLLSMNKLDTIGITGLATDAGNVTLQVNDTASLIFTVEMINWGSGYVNSTGGFDNCTLHSMGGVVHPNCVGFVNVTQGLVIENNGNKNLSVQLVSSIDNESLIGGTQGGGPRFEWNYTNNESFSCRVMSSANGTWLPVNTSAQGSMICRDLYYNLNDTILIHVLINIPQNSLSGQRNATFTATGTALS